MTRTLGVVPPDHPMFGETHFAFYAGPMLSTEELKAAQVTPAEEDEVEFVSPSVPGRRVRMNPARPEGEGE